MSFSTISKVPNTWGGIGGQIPKNPERVVIKADLPVRALLSLPVYGQNYHEEQEIVALGVPFHWKAYWQPAPANPRLEPVEKRGQEIATGVHAHGVTVIDFADPAQNGDGHLLSQGRSTSDLKTGGKRETDGLAGRRHPSP